MIGVYAWQLQPGDSFVSIVYVLNLNFVAHFLLVGDLPWADENILGLVGDHPWQLSPGLSFVSYVRFERTT